MPPSAQYLAAPTTPVSIAPPSAATARPVGGGWTEDRVVLLKALWLEGLSASTISRRLGGVTRNAVIGKVHRLGLSGRATPSRPRRAPVLVPRTRSSTTGGKPPPLPRPPVVPSNVGALAVAFGELVPLLQLSGARCKMPIGDPKAEGFGFCGARATRGPYCAAHGVLAFQVPARTSRRQA